ncbi:MAG: Fe-S cluster assembly protein SufD [Alphaproteobacteria bacterium TMED87]|nr:Fe-S cluster assembly protein SufD [Rhodospirillaceae bacterium]OUV09686.1 MAG: Fe-S cluster assembly protein SufD [Alphaproteobacteria bacterium TMED87]|tara:strand:+ start:79 stop:1398 length:1320 start_codon:yes stop_codon:yes gene_type:complete
MDRGILSPLKKYISENHSIEDRSFTNIKESFLKSSQEIIINSRYTNDHIESWKYTSLDHLLGIEFSNQLCNEDLDNPKLQKIKDEIRPDSINLFFINGHFSSCLSSNGLIESDAFFNQINKENPNQEGYGCSFGRIVSPGSSVLSSLNLYLFKSAGLLKIKKEMGNININIVSISNAKNNAIITHPRFQIILEDGAYASITERHFGISNEVYLTNPLCEILLKDKAYLDHFCIIDQDPEASHIGRAEISLSNNSVYNSFFMCLGGRLTRLENYLHIKGNGARANISGLYCLSRDQHVDISSEVVHDTDSSFSNQNIRGLAKDNSRGIFQGKIKVNKHAINTIASQFHKAILLSGTPEINCKPELEIYTDNVQCSHGATTGEIDEDQLFYLVSRGINPIEAKFMLINGFFEDLILMIKNDIIQDNLRSILGSWIERNILN